MKTLASPDALFRLLVQYALGVTRDHYLCPGEYLKGFSSSIQSSALYEIGPGVGSSSFTGTLRQADTAITRK